MKKGVGSRIRGSGSAPKCQGSPTLLFPKKFKKGDLGAVVHTDVVLHEEVLHAHDVILPPSPLLLLLLLLPQHRQRDGLVP
jgi:hypothetical protein